MPLYEVTLEARGRCTVTVEAENESEAEAKALEEQPGFVVDRGAVDWQVEYVEQTEDIPL